MQNAHFLNYTITFLLEIVWSESMVSWTTTKVLVHT
jgi:hypothetical protein